MRARVSIDTRHGRTVDAALDTWLTPERREQIRVDANAWIKRLRLVPYGSETMRERFRYRDDSLWWFTEIYLHKMRRLETAVAATLALEALRDEHDPTRIRLESPDPVVLAVAEAFVRARGVPVEVSGGAAGGDRTWWQGYLVGATAALSRLRPSAAVSIGRAPRVAAFVHTAFWRASNAAANRRPQESYIGPVLDAMAGRLTGDELFLVGVGPRRNFRARQWWDPLAPARADAPVTPVERLAPRQALRDSRALWRARADLARAIADGPAIREAATFRGLDLWAVLEPELKASAVVQWPWSARAMDEAGAALDTLRPEVVVTYAEAGGWGRALVLEARRRGIPSVGLQHGFIYRHWLNYLHEPDEIIASGADLGFPLPDRTLVFDRVAAEYLVGAGRFPASRVDVTGNARLDALVGRTTRLSEADRAAVRARIGAGARDRVVVLAAKFTEVRDELPAIGAAVGGLTGVRLAIKPHPAETPAVYRPLVDAHANVTIAPPDTELADLLAVADGLITKNSTVAIDSLVLGVPSLVVGLPNNLSPFVAAGVMLGATGADAIRGPLQALLYDLGVRDALARAAREFCARYDLRADGRAADRTVDGILSLTRREEGS